MVPTPASSGPFPARREGFAAAPLRLLSLPSAEFLSVLSVVSQRSKPCLLDVIALLPRVPIGSAFWVPFCFEWNSWVYSAGLLQLV